VTYNSLPPTLYPSLSGIREQIVSSLTTSPKDVIKKYKIELPKLLGWKGREQSLLFQLSNVHKHKRLLEP
jgi:hypothetical protein